jgi:hypothetical protein
MTTATSQNETTTPKNNATEERAKNLAINGDKPLVEVTGFTFPIKGLLWVFGGKYNPETKTWSVPDHKWCEAQTKADELTAKVEANKAAKAAKASQPKQEAKPAPVKAKPVAKVEQPKAAPVKTEPGTFGTVINRCNNLADATTAVYDELMAQFNAALDKGENTEKLQDAIATLSVTKDYLARAAKALA